MPKENSVTDQTKNNLKLLFPDYILEEQSNFDCNEELVNICKTIESKYENFAQNPKKNEKTSIKTIGGYQTKTSKPFLEFDVQDGISEIDVSILKRLKNEILNPAIHRYIKELNLNFNNLDLITNSWFVKYNKNSFQELHTHGTTIFTQVYFVKIPKELKFIGSQPKRYEGTLIISNTKQDWDGTRMEYIKPEEGKLIMFPAHYPHYTLPIISNDERIVIIQDVHLKRI